MRLTGSRAHSLSALGLAHAPVAMAFMDEPPQGLRRVSQAAAAGCVYWQLASEGQSFYTVPDDHGNCPVGAFTHGVELTPKMGRELESLVGAMIELRYIQSSEVTALPRRRKAMQVAVYAPLEHATFVPEVVLFRGNARQVMVLSEAARQSGAFEAGGVLGRPACAMIPQALSARSAVASFGCVGNRVYTDLSDNELYLAVPGGALEPVMDALATILHANAELETFHRQRAATVAG